MNICGTCGRPRTGEYHDLVGVTPVKPPPIVGWVAGQPVHADAEPRPPRMRYTCHMTLVATSPTSGAVYPVNHPQRITELDTRWVHNDRLENA